MAKRYSLFFCVFCGLFSGSGTSTVAQDDSSHILVNVVLVQLNVAVTDRKGNYISGLRPEDFAIAEDKIPEKLPASKKAASTSANSSILFHLIFIFVREQTVG